jgi:hypothetical protein
MILICQTQQNSHHKHIRKTCQLLEANLRFGARSTACPKKTKFTYAGMLSQHIKNQRLKLPFFSMSLPYPVVQRLGFTKAWQHEAKASDASRIGGSVNGGRTPPSSFPTVNAVAPSV